MTDQRPLLEVTDLVKHYAVRGGVLRRRIGTVHAVDSVHGADATAQNAAAHRVMLDEVGHLQ
jgi:oligopeptide transport system ATP-binding protein